MKLFKKFEIKIRVISIGYRYQFFYKTIGESNVIKKHLYLSDRIENYFKIYKINITQSVFHILNNGVVFNNNEAHKISDIYFENKVPIIIKKDFTEFRYKKKYKKYIDKPKVIEIRNKDINYLKLSDEILDEYNIIAGYFKEKRINVS